MGCKHCPAGSVMVQYAMPSAVRVDRTNALHCTACAPALTTCLPHARRPIGATDEMPCVWNKPMFDSRASLWWHLVTCYVVEHVAGPMASTCLSLFFVLSYCTLQQRQQKPRCCGKTPVRTTTTATTTTSATYRDGRCSAGFASRKGGNSEMSQDAADGNNGRLGMSNNNGYDTAAHKTLTRQAYWCLPAASPLSR